MWITELRVFPISRTLDIAACDLSSYQCFFMPACDEVSALLGPFATYLRTERMRGVLTIGRYLSELGAFCSFLRRVHTDGETARHEASALESGRLVRRAHTDAALSAITHLEISAFLRERATISGKPSPAVWNMALSALRAFFAYLNHAEVLTMNPTLKLTRRKVASREKIPPSLDEYVALLEAAEASAGRCRARNVAIVQVLFHTGLRVHELVSLDVDQIEWEARVFRDVPTKGAKWISAPFPDIVAQALEAYLLERAARSEVSEGALFVSTRGARLSIRSVQLIVKALGEAAGIARSVTPHVLRHAFATELDDLGAELADVQASLGHRSRATTERYIHRRNRGRLAAIDALGARVQAARLARAA